MNVIFPIGFHCGVTGYSPADFVRRLNGEGLGVFVKSVDDSGRVNETLSIGDELGIENVVCYRSTKWGRGGGLLDLDVPNYDLPPREAAQAHWEDHLRVFPTDLDSRVWVETCNEVDRNRWDWVGYYCFYMASDHLLPAGRRFVGPGANSGEPEPGDWDSPGWRKYFELCSQNPDRVGVSVHHYNFDNSPWDDVFGDHIGRERDIFRVVDELGLPRPRILVSEYGFAYDRVPPWSDVQEYISRSADHYGARGMVAGLWDLQSETGSVRDQTRALIPFLGDFALSWEPPDPVDPPPPPPPPGIDHKVTAVLLPQDLTVEELNRIEERDGVIETEKRSFLFSADDVVFLVQNGKPGSLAIVYGPERWTDSIEEWLTERGVPFELRSIPPVPGTNPLEGLVLGRPFRVPYVKTSSFNDPRGYGNGLHEGIDFDVIGTNPDSKEPVLSLRDGKVVRVKLSTGNYFNYVITEHSFNGTTFQLWFAHLDRVSVTEGQTIKVGDEIGEIGSTGGDWAEHVHINLTVPDYGLRGYVVDWVVDPEPYIPKWAPPAGNAGFGLHLSADSYSRPGDLEIVNLSRPTVLKCLSSYRPEDLSVLAAIPGVVWVVRAFLDFGGRAVSPTQFVEWTVPDVRRTVDILRSRGREVWVEIHNEPNLISEGFGTAWLSVSQFSTWIVNVLNQYKTQVPGVKFLYPGLSPGPISPGVRPVDHVSFWEWTRAAVDRFDGLGIHSYWSRGFPMESDPNSGIAVVDAAVSKFPGKPIFVTESSNNTREGSPAHKAGEYVHFWRLLRQRPSVRGVSYFVVSSSDPSWDWVKGTGEVWSEDMARIAGSRV